MRGELAGPLDHQEVLVLTRFLKNIYLLIGCSGSLLLCSGFLIVAQRGLLFTWFPHCGVSASHALASFIASRHTGFSSRSSGLYSLTSCSCGTWATHGIFLDVGIKPASVALQGGFLTPGPAGKPVGVPIFNINFKTI